MLKRFGKVKVITPKAARDGKMYCLMKAHKEVNPDRRYH